MTAQQCDWDNLHENDTLPELVLTPTEAHVFMFSAITWNRHHIHYSRDAALAEGHRGVVVQRALLGNFLARMITDWAGDQAQLCRLDWKVVHSTLPNETITCHGEITGIHGDSPSELTASLDVRIVNAEGTTVALGSADVRRSMPAAAPLSADTAHAG